MKDKSGIYVILCLDTNERYIGSSVSIYKRWWRHKWSLRRGKSECAILQRAWIKYGEIAFTFRVIEECSRDKLFEREQFHIDQLKPCYNAVKRVTDRISPEISAKIVKKTLARRAAMTHCKRGHEYTIDNIALRNGGRTKVCRLCIALNKKKPERLAKRRDTRRVKDANGNPLYVSGDGRRIAHNKGESPSTEQRAKISATLTGRNLRPRAEPWVAEGISKTQWYRRQKRAGETPEDTEVRRAAKRSSYHANIEAERAAMRARYRRKVDAVTPN